MTDDRATVVAELGRLKAREVELLQQILGGRACGPDKRGELTRVRLRIRELEHGRRG